MLAETMRATGKRRPTLHVPVPFMKPPALLMGLFMPDPPERPRARFWGTTATLQGCARLPPAPARRLKRERIFGPDFGLLPSSQAPLPRIRFVPKPIHLAVGRAWAGSAVGHTRHALERTSRHEGMDRLRGQLPQVLLRSDPGL
jgi:hypothetical protein